MQLSISYIGIKMGLSSSFQGVGKVFLKRQKVTILGFVRCGAKAAKDNMQVKWAWLCFHKILFVRTGALGP